MTGRDQVSAERLDLWRRTLGVGLALVLTLVAGAVGAQDEEPERALTADQEHEKLFAEGTYPSATTCATCHPTQYREWSVSPHAYSQMSPIFNAMQGAVLVITNGTNGDFCIRCHDPVGMNLEEPEFMTNMDRHPTSREGVTCVVCHRVNRNYGKLSGRLAIERGDLFDPVYGPEGNVEVARVIESSDYRVNPERGKAGRAIHGKAEKFLQLTTSGFCATCHDVNLVNGFRLEEAFSEFKTSPAARKGVSCQDCHMGTEPGVDSGYPEGPAAVVGGKPTRTRRITNHMFIGPDHSVIHPGIFPHNTAASELATIRQWLTYDHEAGWGTDEFETNVAEDYEFPEHWSSADDRYDARDILTDNIELLAEANRQRRHILRVAYRLMGVEILKADPEKGLVFQVEVANGTDGHGVPTGFDAERVVFLRVTVTGPDGNVVFRSGDLDPNGDLRDNHSLYVHNGELPLDKQLFSLQGRFLTRMVRGGEREQILALNFSPDPLPFLRPSTTSTILTGRPRGARKHKQNIEPAGRRYPKYKVKPSQLSGSGTYKIRVELVAGMLPVNLVNRIRIVGFDYGLTTKQIAERVVAGHQVLWQQEIEARVGEVRTAGGTGGAATGEAGR
ncbi:MAG: multiheme c-type cytochrome [Thermoanaerobaculia bacterium]